MSEQEMKDYVARNTQGVIISKEEEAEIKKNNLVDLDNYVARDAVPRPKKDLSKLSTNERLKEERNIRARALEESVKVDDGWKMRLGDGPARGPSQLKKRKKKKK